MTKLPLTLSSISNTPGAYVDCEDHKNETTGQFQPEDELQLGKKHPPSQQGLQETASSKLYSSKQKQRYAKLERQAVSQNAPLSRKMLASPRTARMIASKAQEVAKRVPRSWENPLSPQRSRPLQRARVYKEHERISRSEACSPRVSNTAELWNEGLTPRQLDIRLKACL
ncbi:hypothetical protein WJX74_005847 [Apatococcus lobatus]|uniref:Uncharacterized protein n=1 Tax=Apatococcus lobatus TaxID=904363 RepID=A0AAW1RYK0_9CHLO